VFVVLNTRVLRKNPTCLQFYKFRQSESCGIRMECPCFTQISFIHLQFHKIQRDIASDTEQVNLQFQNAEPVILNDK
jgi:hypothetical protein